MAKRRMFSKDIVSSDQFKLMPLSSQALYFHLGMEADDRGYVDNAVTLMRAIGANQGDMEQLISRKFVLVRDKGLILIKGWRINNYIQKDRFEETKYTDDLKLLYLDENSSYTQNPTNRLCIQNVSKTDTQDRLGKDSIGKDSIGKSNNINKLKKESNKENDIDYLKMMLEIGGLSKTKEAIDEYIKNNDLKLTDSEYQEIMKGI